MNRYVMRRFTIAAAFSVAIAGALAAQGAKFTGGYFRASDGTNDIGLDFDSTGRLTAYVNTQAFSEGTWQTKADTMTFGPVRGPEGYSCAGDGRYLWSLTENRLSFTALADDCAIRQQTLTGLVWTKG